MPKSSREVRTLGLLVVAILLIAVGLISYMSSEWELSLGPTTPVTTLPPKDSASQELAPLQAMGLIQGLAVTDIGLPSQVAVGLDRLYVADAYASVGVLKVFDFKGTHLFSFGNIGQGELSYVVGIAVNDAGDIVVLDTSTTIFVYSPEGKLHKVMDLDKGSRPELAWARAVQPTGDGYYVLALDKVYSFDLEGRYTGSSSPKGDDERLAMSPSEFYLGPSGLAAYGTSLWVSDSVNGRLLRLGSNGRFDQSVTLPTKDGIDPYPTAIQIDDYGNFLVVDAARQVLLKLLPSGEPLSEAKIGSASVLDGPDDVFSLALAHNGMLFLSDSHTGTVNLWDVSQGLKLGEDLVNASARFLFPRVVAVLGNDVYISSSEPRLGKEMEHKVLKTDFAGLAVQEFVTSWDGEPLHGPVSIKFYDNHVYILDGSRVLVLEQDGTPLRTIGDETADWGGFGTAYLLGYATGPQGLAFDNQGNVWVADTNRQRLVVFDRSGGFLTQIALGDQVWPQSLAFSPDGTLLVLNGYEGQIIRMDTSGSILTTFGSPGHGVGELGVIADMNSLDGPRDLVVSNEGYIYVVDTYNSRIVTFTAKGTFEAAAGTFGSAMGEVYLPSGITYHAESDFFFLADTYNHRVQMFKIQ
ncbi:MAG: hypothetical protein KGZ53_09980 [Peptococcaceae bacterium]|nr:hypothetical protein [Peptococcaceae bacterium]